MLNLNQQTLETVAQEAFDKATGSRRWQTAIGKAKAQLESNPYIHDEGNALLILSDSGEIYEASVACQCRAYRQGQPCWHRAAARLVKRYAEQSH